MSKFYCKCGYVISTIEYPSPAEYVVFNQEAYDAFLAGFARALTELKQAESDGKRQEWIDSQLSESYPRDSTDTEVIEDIVTLKSFSLSRSAVRCESCGRFYIQNEPGTNDYTSFIREPNQPSTQDD